MIIHRGRDFIRTETPTPAVTYEVVITRHDENGPRSSLRAQCFGQLREALDQVQGMASDQGWLDAGPPQINGEQEQ
jgi:hypothetical protein